MRGLNALPRSCRRLLAGHSLDWGVPLTHTRGTWRYGYFDRLFERSGSVVSKRQGTAAVQNLADFRSCAVERGSVLDCGSPLPLSGESVR